MQENNTYMKSRSVPYTEYFKFYEPGLKIIGQYILFFPHITNQYVMDQ
jgi:hypothetical protein